ncbi:hypothetical protein ACWEWP_15325 [Streptomyces olivaceus]
MAPLQPSSARRAGRRTPPYRGVDAPRPAFVLAAAQAVQDALGAQRLAERALFRALAEAESGNE